MGEPEARWAGGLGGRREDEHLSVKTKSPSLKVDTFLQDVTLGELPAHEVPSRGKALGARTTPAVPSLSLPQPEPQGPGWAKKQLGLWGGLCGAMAGPWLGLGTKNEDGLLALPPPRAAEGFQRVQSGAPDG